MPQVRGDAGLMNKKSSGPRLKEHYRNVVIPAIVKRRQGLPIGLKVTLRGVRMYEFMDRLINASVPRIRDFRGVDPRGFDGRRNYNMGLNQQHIFPEVNLDKSPKVRGLNITFITNAGSDERARELLALFGVPFKTNERETAKKTPAAAAHAAGAAS